MLIFLIAVLSLPAFGQRKKFLENKVNELLTQYKQLQNDLLSKQLTPSQIEELLLNEPRRIFTQAEDTRIFDDLDPVNKDGYEKVGNYLSDLMNIRGFSTYYSLVPGSIVYLGAKEKVGNINLRAYINKKVPKRIDPNLTVIDTHVKKYTVAFVLDDGGQSGMVNDIRIAGIHPFEDEDKDNVDDRFDDCLGTLAQDLDHMGLHGCPEEQVPLPPPIIPEPPTLTPSNFVFQEMRAIYVDKGGVHSESPLSNIYQKDNQILSTSIDGEIQLSTIKNRQINFTKHIDKLPGIIPIDKETNPATEKVLILNTRKKNKENLIYEFDFNTEQLTRLQIPAIEFDYVIPQDQKINIHHSARNTTYSISLNEYSIYYKSDQFIAGIKDKHLVVWQRFSERKGLVWKEISIQKVPKRARYTCLTIDEKNKRLYAGTAFGKIHFYQLTTQ